MDGRRILLPQRPNLTTPQVNVQINSIFLPEKLTSHSFLAFDYIKNDLNQRKQSIQYNVMRNKSIRVCSFIALRRWEE